jgi:hypothetical protein
MSDGAIILALSDFRDRTSPYKTKPCDKQGNPMPERLWELAQSCFKRQASERPAVAVIAAMLPHLQMKHSSLSGAENPSESSATTNNCEHPTSVSNSSVVYGKRKQRSHMRDEDETVRFGPLNLDGNTEGPLLYEILDGLLKAIRRDVLVLPHTVEKHNTQYLDLRFQSPVEANNFAMTWMFYRYDPYKEVSAVLLDVE